MHEIVFALSMKEHELQANVIELAQQLGWLAYHTHDSRHSEAGFPDLVLLRGGVQIVAELKTQRGTVAVPQHLWLGAFGAAGVQWFVWRPSDWLDGTIKRVLA